MTMTRGARQFLDIRKTRGLSQDAMAKLIDTHASMISHIETGRKTPGLHLALKIEETLEIPPRHWIEEGS